MIPTEALPQNQARAVQAYQTMVKTFAIAGTALFREAINPDDNKYCAFLWPYAGILAGVAALARLKNIGTLYQPELGRVLTGLDAYYDAGSRPPAYQSYILSQGGGDRFYDDNAWVGLLYLDAYRTLKKDVYLPKAVEIFNYSISGWDEEMGGGIYWREYHSQFDHKTKNTCSNAPVAILALQLYQETGQDQYLQWGQKIVKWMERLKSTDHGIYADNIDKDGFIDKRFFTYNTGTMIHANVLLYETLKDEKYLQEARSLAEAAYKYFPRNFGTGIALYHDDPWFVTVLLRGYIALYEADPAKDWKYIDHMRQNLNYAWEHAQARTGLFGHNFQGPAVPTTRKWILDQAAMVEHYALISQYD